MKNQIQVICLGIIMLFLFEIDVAKCQSALKIGDQVPDVTFTNVKNHTNKTIKLSNFKGKLIIIDFWNKWCSPCISAFPKMEELQRKFGSDIQILLVTTDTDEQLKTLYQSSEILKNTKLPIITSDTVLKKIFPHSSVPYHVWIDKEGKVKATLNDFNTNSETIENYLASGKTSFTFKQDIFSHELKYGPLFNQIIGTGYDQMKQVQAYTIFTKRNLYNSGSMEVVDTASKRMINYPIIFLFRSIYSQVQLPANAAQLNESDIKQIKPKNDVKIEINTKLPEDKKKYFYPSRNISGFDDWINKNIYCYERVFESSVMKLPHLKRVQVQNTLVIGDFERFFSLTSKMEYRNEKCLIIYKLGNNGQFETKGGERIHEKTANKVFRLRNYPVGTLISIISSRFMLYSGEIPVIDETGYNGNIDVDFNFDDNRSVESLNKDLNRFGLGIKTESRMVKCITLEEI